MVAMAVVSPESNDSVVSVCERGYGKRSSASEFGEQRRGGKGLIAIKTSERNGRVVGCRVVAEENDLMMITNGGKVIRMPVADISLIGRNTQGVRLIRLDGEESVVSVEQLADQDDEGQSNDDDADQAN